MVAALTLEDAQAAAPSASSAIQALRHGLGDLSEQEKEAAIVAFISSSFQPAAISRISVQLKRLLVRDFILLLPAELSTHILSFLNAADLCRAARVSRTWCALACDNAVWRTLYYAQDWRPVTRALDAMVQQAQSLAAAQRTPATNGLGVILSPQTAPPPFLVTAASDLASSSTSPAAASSTTPPTSPLLATTNDATQGPLPKKLSTPANLAASFAHRLAHRWIRSDARSSSSSSSSKLSRKGSRASASSAAAAANLHQSQLQPIVDNHLNWRYFYKQRHVLLQNIKRGRFQQATFLGHQQGIYCIQADEDKVISGSRDDTIKVWNIATGTCRRSICGHEASVLCLQYTEKYIFSGSSDRTIRMWSLADGTHIRTIKGHNDAVLNLRADEEHERIISCSKDRTVRIWSWDGTEKACFTGHAAAVNAIQVSGDTVVSASGDRKIKLWSIKNKTCIGTLEGHGRGIACVAFDGRYIVSGSSDQTIRVWDIQTMSCIRSIPGHSDLVRSIAFDVYDDMIVSGGYDSVVRLWRFSTGAQIMELPLTSRQERVFNVCLRRGRVFAATASSVSESKIILWDFRVGVDVRGMVE
ncbi:hypothetical protein RI367_006886 [Sorochytrium milnesiophthora]